MARPLVGITFGETAGPARPTHPNRRSVTLGVEYVDAVADDGGLPVVVVPAGDDPADVVRRLDALVLSGGADVAPATYGAAPHPALGPTDEAVDRWEIALVRRALDDGLPVLAVCRGIQVLNVARGGTLWQDLPTEAGLEGHRQTAPGTEATHDVDVAPGSRLATVVGSGPLATNSFHHQAVRDVGAGLDVVARTADGVVEALEDRDAAFCIGVQWHAETLVGACPHRALFAALVDAAR
ncbi:MAG: gamma-glutamyl-gamma-aminobutyrate hydrolase family protein [Solirubrobacteraceae bacterium]|nr:gamma-glutamyl-gamma-aminobutyrate hydrolase family protein [Solirubrobacteraceae bacterium]